MRSLLKVTKTFPFTRIPSKSGLPVEVSLISQLSHGLGDKIFHQVHQRQAQHSLFVDQLEEPSTKLGGTNFEKGDPSSLYSFVVGPKGHPFHCHEGHRVFIAFSGSGGSQLRFSTVQDDELHRDPSSFLRYLHFVNIPPDSVFSVRFGGRTWHQFVPLHEKSSHPTFFALSVHTNELGGNLTEDLKQKVIRNEADIPSLTRLLPQEVYDLLLKEDPRHIQTTTLSLDAPANSLNAWVCKVYRSFNGSFKSMLTGIFSQDGYISTYGRDTVTKRLVPEGCLLKSCLPDHDHEDMQCISINRDMFQKDLKSSDLMIGLLNGFLNNSPKNVGRMMKLRNILVSPLKLRTSTLGCPISSLKSKKRDHLFANTFPVHDQVTNDDDTLCEVILGADDKHLVFRSCVRVEIDEKYVKFSLGTRVRTSNAFGWMYMHIIDAPHQKYVSPMMLTYALGYCLDNFEK